MEIRQNILETLGDTPLVRLGRFFSGPALVAAKIEALEEAGAVGFISDEAVGVYHYDKRLDRKRKVRCRVTVYPMMVDKLKRRWKERKERKRHWFSLKKAAKLVNEKELSALLKDLAQNPERLGLGGTSGGAS